MSSAVPSASAVRCSSEPTVICTSAPVSRIAGTGVRKRELMFLRNSGIRLSRAMASGKRELLSRPEFAIEVRVSTVALSGQTAQSNDSPVISFHASASGQALYQ